LNYEPRPNLKVGRYVRNYEPTADLKVGRYVRNYERSNYK